MISSISFSDGIVEIPEEVRLIKKGEKFDYYDFAKSISKNSKVSVFLVENKVSLIKYLKNNINPKEIVIGMGAGSISNWIRELPKFLK